MAEEEGRPTTAIDGAALRDLVSHARDPQSGRAALKAALDAAPRATDAIAPIVFIVDRPAKVRAMVASAVPKRTADIHRVTTGAIALDLDPATRQLPKLTPLDRTGTGVALPEEPVKRPRFDVFVLAALLFVLAAVLWMALA